MPEAPQDTVKSRVEGEVGRRIGTEGADSNRGRVAATELRRRMQEKDADTALRYAAEGAKGVTDVQQDALLLQFKKGRRQEVSDLFLSHNTFLRGELGTLDEDKKLVWDKYFKSRLDESIMGNLFRDTTDPNQVRSLTVGLLSDQQFMLIYQDRLSEITNSKAHLSVTDEKVQERAQLLVASKPGKYPDIAAAERDARKALYQEWQDTTVYDLQNVGGVAINRYLTQQLETAREASGEVNSLMVKDAIARYEQRWHQSGKEGREAVKQSFESFMQGGGANVLGSETWNSMTDAEKNEFNKKFGEKMFTERMLAGQFKKDDMRLLATAEWLGADFPARVDKIREMFEANSQYTRLITESQANGTIDKNVWDKIKAAGPYAAGGMLAALIAALAFPISVPALLTGAAAVGGAGAAGYGKYAFDSRDDA